jgi:competence protein ComEC
VDIQNVSGEEANLSGWRLVSEKGNQSCTLKGIMQPNEVLRVWAGNGATGYSCGYSGPIWNNSELDPAVLYNPQGKEVSRYP